MPINALGPKMGTSVYYHARAYHSGKAILAPGVHLKIPRCSRHLYFDFETSDNVHPSEPPHVYLIGLWDGEREEFVHFLGRGAEDECRIFRDFLNYIGNPEGVCLYHWTDFEIWEIKGVAERHPEISSDLEKLKNSCVDLKDVIKQQLYLPVPTYSIKSAAPLMGFSWRHNEVDAFESMVLYWDYLKEHNEQKIQKVLDYNEDDCRAMIWVDSQICKEFGEHSKWYQNK